MRKMLQIHGNMFDLEIADAKTLVMPVAHSSNQGFGSGSVLDPYSIGPLDPDPDP